MRFKSPNSFGATKRPVWPRLEDSERRNISTSRKAVLTEHGSTKGDIAGIIVKGLLDGRITFKVVMSQRAR